MFMNRPTLAQQLAEEKWEEELNKLSDAEVEALFLPHGFWEHVDFWLFDHIHFIFSLFWGSINWLKPYNFNTRTRHWRYWS